jgi:hypothetical protein
MKVKSRMRLVAVDFLVCVFLAFVGFCNLGAFDLSSILI